jgi:aminoglycoside phosphotransferase
MNFPDSIKAALSGFTTTGESLKTHSESDVFRYEHLDTGDVVFLKIQRPSWSPPLSLERDAMAWLHTKTTVPEVVVYHLEDDVEYLVTKALPGISTENEECHGDKQHLVKLLADSLHLIHAIPTAGCPVDKTPAALIVWGRERIEAGIITQKMVEEEGLAGSPDEALDDLESRMPDLEGPVTTHGDFCLPNIMIHDNQVSGFIDLGYVGIGDPYRDFIAGKYSVRRNLGAEWVQPFFDAYGIETPDEQKLVWYRQIQAFD